MDRCLCAELPDALPGKLLTDETSVAANVEEVAVTDAAGTYRCLACGQVWEDRFLGRQGLFKIAGPT